MLPSIHPPTGMHPCILCTAVPPRFVMLLANSSYFLALNACISFEWNSRNVVTICLKLLFNISSFQLPFCVQFSSLNTHQYIYHQHTVYKELIEGLFFFSSPCKVSHFMESWIFVPTRSGFSDLYATSLQRRVSTFSDSNTKVDINSKGGPEFCRQRAAGQDKWALHIDPHHPKGLSKWTGQELIRFYRHGNDSNC